MDQGCSQAYTGDKVTVGPAPGFQIEASAKMDGLYTETVCLVCSNEKMTI